MTATHPYAHLLGDRDPFAVLAETRQRIPAIAQALGPEGLKRTYAPGKWTAAQVISHLADCEIAFGFRVRQIIPSPPWEFRLLMRTSGRDITRHGRVGGGAGVSGNSRLEPRAVPPSGQG